MLKLEVVDFGFVHGHFDSFAELCILVHGIGGFLCGEGGTVGMLCD